MPGMNELFILLVIALLVIGPKRLPEYTQKLTNIVRELRRMATGAKEQLKEETGVDLNEVDWRKYDPRQYDPRKIIRDALLEDAPAGAQKTQDPAVAQAAAAAAAALAEAAPPAPVRTVERLAPGQPAPFDADAT
ncbi:twin-arginine translocase TatA/TatE family subunit [Sinomonas sp. JGH33]|uniref:Twin-arginine translocase TatA/TatE family subunit n=1 Tax=Sinomonas terricola TaxID=3110330 RepID=A0ABU5T0L1_9MICC|nr:twin-arginine translocase TatA/TatE family subunit [Sinomonas sp. JGH33]MEA5453188.1 twin-arginine translocase TatA/TatE family subunit [Sinomonas sp. JGH33]